MCRALGKYFSRKTDARAEGGARRKKRGIHKREGGGRRKEKDTAAAPSAFTMTFIAYLPAQSFESPRKEGKGGELHRKKRRREGGLGIQEQEDSAEAHYLYSFLFCMHWRKAE